MITEKPTMSLKRPQPANVPDPSVLPASKVEEFLNAPEQARKDLAGKGEGTPSLTQFPWEAIGMNERVLKQFPLRLPETDLAKIQYIVENSIGGSHKSKHEFCSQLIKAKIDELLKGVAAK